MTIEEYKELFKQDENGCFVKLVIPPDGDKDELNLIGKKPEDFSLEEVVRMKKYSRKLFKLIRNN